VSDRLREVLHQLADALADELEGRNALATGERLLTYREVATRLGVHVNTARKRGRRGAWREVLEAGAQPRVRESEFLVYLKSLKVREPIRRANEQPLRLRRMV
jgi:DNA-binding transcriptional regulator YhcF (GntR family)